MSVPAQTVLASTSQWKMNGTSRKVKNPLLSAAGPGFPFDNYAENTLLMPVTPATPAVLRDGEFIRRKITWAGLKSLQILHIVRSNDIRNSLMSDSEASLLRLQPLAPFYSTSFRLIFPASRFYIWPDCTRGLTSVIHLPLCRHYREKNCAMKVPDSSVGRPYLGRPRQFSELHKIYAQKS